MGYGTGRSGKKPGSPKEALKYAHKLNIINIYTNTEIIYPMKLYLKKPNFVLSN